eukprot:PhM_4_TR18729/c2_g1_i24/m.73833
MRLDLVIVTSYCLLLCCHIATVAVLIPLHEIDFPSTLVIALRSLVLIPHAIADVRTVNSNHNLTVSMLSSLADIALCAAVVVLFNVGSTAGCVINYIIYLIGQPWWTTDSMTPSRNMHNVSVVTRAIIAAMISWWCILLAITNGNGDRNPLNFTSLTLDDLDVAANILFGLSGVTIALLRKFVSANTIKASNKVVTLSTAGTTAGAASGSGVHSSSHSDTLIDILPPARPRARIILSPSPCSPHGSPTGASCASYTNSPVPNMDEINNAMKQALPDEFEASLGSPLHSCPSFSSEVNNNLSSRANKIMRARQSKVYTKGEPWKRGALLGSGAFGTVHSALSDKGTIMAVKSLTFDAGDKELQSKLAMLQNEISILQKLDHTNIVKYYDAERVGTAVNIFMEYVPGGSIKDIVANFGALSETTVVQYTYQIVLGLEYLHRNHVLHGDIKGANILVNVDGTVKLADFGSATVSLERVAVARQTGTPLWMAPEVVRGEYLIGWSSDIWALGCTVMEMLTGRPPWDHMGMDRLSTIQTIADATEPLLLPEGINPLAARFLRDCLVRDPCSRWTAEELLSHSFFRSVNCFGDVVPSDENSLMSPVLDISRVDVLRELASNTANITLGSLSSCAVQPFMMPRSRRSSQVLSPPLTPAGKQPMRAAADAVEDGGDGHMISAFLCQSQQQRLSNNNSNVSTSTIYNNMCPNGEDNTSKMGDNNFENDDSNSLEVVIGCPPVVVVVEE